MDHSEIIVVEGRHDTTIKNTFGCEAMKTGGSSIDDKLNRFAMPQAHAV